MRSLARGDSENALKLLIGLSENPLLSKYYVEDLSDFDWEQAKKDFDVDKFPILKQYFFAVYKNLARLLKDQIKCYMQVRWVFA